MNPSLFLVGIGILATALVLLLFAGGSPVDGITGDQFARLASLSAVGVLLAAGLVASRGQVGPRLWHVAVWLALLVALMLGYQSFGPR